MAVMSPRVSIIISTYNGAAYIGETIASIRDQTYRNWELIIVDDGSTDDTENVITSFQDDRIQFIKAGRIGINGKIKNMGLDKISGEFIAFIDHDDLWAQNKLEKQMIALQTYSEAGFCLVNGYNFKHKGEPVNFFYHQRQGIRIDKVFLSFFQSQLSAWTQTLLMRRECLQAGRFSETSLFADPEFVFNLACQFKAVVLFEPMVYRRQHASSYSTVNWIPCQEQGIKIITKYKNSKLLPPAVAKNALFRSHIDFGEKYIREKQSRKAIRHFFKAWGNKIFSIAPAKKIMKAVLYSFRQA